MTLQAPVQSEERGSTQLDDQAGEGRGNESAYKTKPNKKQQLKR